MSGMVLSFSGKKLAPGTEFYRVAGLRNIPPGTIERLAQHFVSMEPRPTTAEFFDGVLDGWEYALLTDGSSDTSVQSEGWSGFLKVLDAGVPLDYANFLRPDYSIAERTDFTGRWSSGWGYSEVIALYAAGVPVEYVEQCVASGIQDAETICRLYVDAVPLEYVTATT